MIVLDGKVVSQSRRKKLKDKVAQFVDHHARPPGLAVVLVGQNPASQVYVANKIKACAEVGILSFEHKVSEQITQKDLEALLSQLNAKDEVDGILLQLPLPQGLDADLAINTISPEKDADCLTTLNMGRLWSQAPLTKPCTPSGVMAILEHYQLSPKGLRAVVIGRSAIVGRPMAHLLTMADATVTLCHSRTVDLRSYTKNAELVVVAAGRPEFLGREDFAQDAIVIDVGIHRRSLPDKGLCGDVRYNELKGLVKAATPVPGGVGPMTITMLLENTLTLAQARGSSR